jgi:hypothetical protein
MRPGQGNSCMRRLGIVALGAALLGRALGTISLGPPPQFKKLFNGVRAACPLPHDCQRLGFIKRKEQQS